VYPPASPTKIISTMTVSTLPQFLLCWALLIIPSSSFPPSNRFAVVSGTLLRRHNLSPEKVAAAREELVDAETGSYRAHFVRLEWMYTSLLLNHANSWDW